MHEKLIPVDVRWRRREFVPSAEPEKAPIKYLQLFPGDPSAIIFGYEINA